MLVRLENIRKGYGDQQVLMGLSLQIEKGEMIAVTGRSGCGKTTLLNILSGTDDFEGIYMFEDEFINCRDKRSLEKLRREKVSRIFQDYQLLEHLSCRQNILMPAVYGRKDKGKADRILETIGLKGYQKRKISELSGGEKQRIAIGRCLMSGNPLILADEPTGALDAENGRMIMGLIRQLCDEGFSALIVTHDRETADLCDRKAELRDGVLLQ